MFLWRRVAPQSPEEGLKPTAAPGYARNFRALNRLIAEGKSFSGYERNILLLNMRGQKFADVAGAFGVDYDDDARAVATADWDGDGGLDLWVTNRTAPRVRLLHNRAAAGRAFLAVRLAGNGTTTNRNAVGARLTLWPTATPQERQIRTVRAGDGFLSQSSSWSHFGLGAESGELTLAVAWPGGREQTFAGLRPNGRYLIRQDDTAAPSPLPPAPPAALPPAPEEPEDTRASGFWVANRVPFPRIDYQDEAGAARSTLDFLGRPVLVNLWATWCAPCLKELSEIAGQADAFRTAGATVLALNVDGLAVENAGEATAKPEDVLARIGYSLARGQARPDSLDRIELLVEFLSARRLPLSIPTSFLLDAEGQVAAVYLEPVSVAQLTADLALLRAPAGESLRRLSPRTGRWFADPRQGDPAVRLGEYAAHFGANGFPEESQRLYQLARPQGGGGSAPDLYNQAKAAAEQGRPDEAMRLYREALRLQPDFGQALTGLGALLLGQGKPDEARPHFEKALALDPNHATALVNMAMIDQRRGDTDSALARLQSVIARNPDYAEAHLNLGSLYGSLKRPEDAIRHLGRAAEINPKLIPARLNLAIAYKAARQPDKAEATYRQLLAENPRLGPAHLGLAIILGEQNRHPEAIDSAQLALSLGVATAPAYTQLGVSRLALGQRAEAIEALDKALTINPQYQPARLARERATAVAP